MYQAYYNYNVESVVWYILNNTITLGTVIEIEIDIPPVNSTEMGQITNYWIQGFNQSGQNKVNANMCFSSSTDAEYYLNVILNPNKYPSLTPSSTQTITPSSTITNTPTPTQTLTQTPSVTPSTTPPAMNLYESAVISDSPTSFWTFNTLTGTNYEVVPDLMGNNNGILLLNGNIPPPTFTLTPTPSITHSTNLSPSPTPTPTPTLSLGAVSSPNDVFVVNSAIGKGIEINANNYLYPSGVELANSLQLSNTIPFTLEGLYYLYNPSVDGGGVPYDYSILFGSGSASFDDLQVEIFSNGTFSISGGYSDYSATPTPTITPSLPTSPTPTPSPTFTATPPPSGGLPLTLDAWHHIAIVNDPATNYLYYYVDGVMVYQTPNTNSYSIKYLGTNLYGYYLNGVMDEVAFYSSALSLTQIQNHYNAAKNYFNTIPPQPTPTPSPSLIIVTATPTPTPTPTPTVS